MPKSESSKRQSNESWMTREEYIESWAREHGSEEKMHEELMTEKEGEMGFETDDMYIIPPQVQLEEISHKLSDYKNIKISKIKNYKSKEVEPISKEEIRKLLLKNKKTED